MTAFELCGVYDGQNFRLKSRGRVVWNSIDYRWRNNKCFVQRVVPADEWFTIRSAYISADAEIEIVKLNRETGKYELQEQ